MCRSMRPGPGLEPNKEEHEAGIRFGTPNEERHEAGARFRTTRAGA